ncbi:hypothetical protein Hanom_Chr07g00652721 [Helianthus anomalus]
MVGGVHKNNCETCLLFSDISRNELPVDNYGRRYQLGQISPLDLLHLYLDLPKGTKLTDISRFKKAN